MKVKCVFLYAITLSHYELKFSMNVVDSECPDPGPKEKKI